jgi:hypothetical protein
LKSDERFLDLCIHHKDEWTPWITNYLHSLCAGKEPSEHPELFRNVTDSFNGSLRMDICEYHKLFIKRRAWSLKIKLDSCEDLLYNPDTSMQTLLVLARRYYSSSMALWQKLRFLEICRSQNAFKREDILHSFKKEMFHPNEIYFGFIKQNSKQKDSTLDGTEALKKSIEELYLENEALIYRVTKLEESVNPKGPGVESSAPYVPVNVKTGTSQPRGK